MGPACNLPRLRFRAGIRIRVISEIIGKINEHLRILSLSLSLSLSIALFVETSARLGEKISRERARREENPRMQNAGAEPGREGFLR
jgi:hypothetical protein